jgi:20S proteasome subunit alpha 4
VAEIETEKEAEAERKRQRVAATQAGQASMAMRPGQVSGMASGEETPATGTSDDAADAAAGGASGVQ